MAGIRKKANRAGRFQAWYLDMNGKRVFFTGTHDRRETLRMAVNLEDQHLQIRLGYRELPESQASTRRAP